jgi:hypothetical protein
MHELASAIGADSSSNGQNRCEAVFTVEGFSPTA